MMQSPWPWLLSFFVDGTLPIVGLHDLRALHHSWVCYSHDMCWCYLLNFEL